MYDKSYYRTVLLELKPIVKLSYYCDLLNIQPGNLSRFLKDDYHDECMSITSLDNLYNSIIKTFNKYS